MAHSIPGGIKTTKATVRAHYAAKGLDVDLLAVQYIEAWATKVPVGTQMMVAKMKCALAEGECGCGPQTPVFKCTGPYPSAPIEIIKEWLLPEDGSPCLIEGVEAEMLLGPEAHIIDGKLIIEEFVGPYSNLVGGPSMTLYVKKTA